MLLRFIIYAFTLYLIILFVMVNAVKIFRMNLKKNTTQEFSLTNIVLLLFQKCVGVHFLIHIFKLTL